MTTTLEDANHVAEALVALAAVTDDAGLTNWDDRYTSNERYLNLPASLVMKLEDAYDKRLREIAMEEGP